MRCRLVSFGRVEPPHARGDPSPTDRSVAANAEAVIVPRDPSADGSRPLTDAERAQLEAELDLDAVDRLDRNDAPTVDEMFPVPAVADPHDRDPARRARRVQRPAVPDVTCRRGRRCRRRHRRRTSRRPGRSSSYLRFPTVAMSADERCGEVPPDVRPRRRDVPVAAVVRAHEPPGEPRAIEPGNRLTAERRRLRRGRPHSPPQM